MDVELRETAYDHSDALRLTELVLALYVERYGGEGDTAPVDAEHFHAPDGYFIAAYIDDEAVGMGGWRRHGAGEAEIKRMFVRPEFQGKGIARMILAHLEETAAKAGFTRFVLETGLEQPEAIALYRSAGYEDIPAFGFYADDPLSVHLGKRL